MIFGLLGSLREVMGVIYSKWFGTGPKRSDGPQILPFLRREFKQK